MVRPRPHDLISTERERERGGERGREREGGERERESEREGEIEEEKKRERERGRGKVYTGKEQSNPLLINSKEQTNIPQSTHMHTCTCTL